MEALRELCNYSTTDQTEPSELEQQQQSTIECENYEINSRPTLHEILVQEKLDFEAKVQRAAKRKRWLRGTSLRQRQK